ncbi:MAG: LamG-like jellyroll fold domain-containing protein [Bacteroidota bacterium]
MSGGVSWAESKALITPFAKEGTEITDSGFTPHWTPIPNAQKYFLRIATDPLLTQVVTGWENVEVGNVTSFQVSGLREHTCYYFGVMSQTDRLSAWSPSSPKVKTTGGSAGELAIDLEGAANYLDLSAHISRIAGKKAGAITGWFKGTQNGILYEMSGTNSSADYMRIGVGDIEAGMDDESFWFWISRGGSVVLSMGVKEGHEKYLDNNWHHFAIITGDGNNRILIDGEEKQLHICNNYGSSLTQEFSNITSPSKVYIGKNLSVMVDELAIYSNPITDDEVIDRAHRKLLGDEMGLILYYDFNQVNNTTILDASGKGRNASVAGAVDYAASHVLSTPFIDETVTGVTVAQLNWLPIDGAHEYLVDVARDELLTNKLVENASSSTNSFPIDQLDKNKRYFFRVKSIVEGVHSEWSAVKELHTIPGKSMTFDASLNQYIRVDGIANYSSDQATIECWIKPGYRSGNLSLWAHNNAIDNTNQYVLVYIPTTRKLGLWTMDASNALLAYELPGEYDLMGSWNHIAASIIKDGLSTIYLNGKKIFEFTHHLPPIVNGFQFSIGQEWDNIYAESDFYHGEMDEFRVWNIALSEEQIRANMNISKPEWASDHFIAHYTFDEIYNGITVKDHANYNHGRLFGGITTTSSTGTVENEANREGLPGLVASEGVINPITLEPTDITSGSFTLNLNNIPSVESFEVVVAYDPTFVPPLAAHKNIGKSLSYVMDDLCPGVKYYYRARAVYDDNTISDWSAIDTVTTVNEDAVITQFNATQGDYSGKLKLTWACDNDYLITEFVISRRIEGKGEYEVIASVPNDGSLMQYTDTTALPGTYYEYSIQGMSYCYQNDTEVVYSNIGFNIPSLTTTKKINSETNETYILIAWQYHPNFCSNVEILRTDTESGIEQTFQEVADSLVYRDTDAGLCTPYRYQLVAKTQRFGDINSRNALFTLEQEITHAMDTLDASKAYYDNRIILNWVSTSQNVIDEYQISRRRYGSGNAWQVVKIIDRGTTQTWIDEDVIAGIYYEYAIVGFAACGNNLLMTDSVFSVGIRQPEGAISGQVNYQGGNPVRDVKITTTYNDPSVIKGHSLSFSGNDSLVITRRNDFANNGITLEMYIKPNSLNQYFSLFENNNMMLEYDGAGNLMAQCGSAATLYNIIDNSMNTWESNAWNHVSVSAGEGQIKLFVNGEMVSSATGDLLTDLDQMSLVGREYQGQIDELRIWGTALSDEIIFRNHTLVLGRDETFLLCGLRFDEGFGAYAFDHSRTEGEPNKTHADVYGAQWSQDIPGVGKLSPGAFTQANGSYQVNGLRFVANGQTYKATPSLGVHAFDPADRTMLISENSLVHGNQDFTDISSFVVTGNVKYLGAEFPVEEVMIAVDGQIAVNVEGQPIVTDQHGNFTIEVPIGDHFISVQKIGHTFSQGYFPPKDENGEITYFNFNDNVSGIQFIDSTFITVAGRIVGGTVEGVKPIGMGLSKNNIGVSSFTVKAAKGYPISENYPDGESGDAQPVYEITVNTDPATGEYEIKLLPEVYEFVGQIGNQQYVFNSIDDLAVIDLSGMMSLSTDTAETEGGGLLYYDYHVKRNWVYRSVPKIEVAAVDGTPHFYDLTLTAEDANLNPVEIDLLTADHQHVLGYPVFTKGASYNALVSIFEEYENIDSGVLDQVPVNDGTLTVINTCAAYPAPVEYPITNGAVEYSFYGGFPNPAINSSDPALSYTKTLEMHAATGEGGTMQSQWPENGPFRAYVFGGIPTGNNFVTQGPDLVDFVLRDPAGSNSRAYFESGFTISNSVTSSFSNSKATSIGVEIDLGWEVTTFVGFGVGIISTKEQIANAETGVSYESQWEHGNFFTTTTTVNKSYSTSDDPAFVGEQGDLFFGHSTNISYGVSNYVKLLPIGTGEDSSELDMDINGFTIGQKKGINFGIQYNTDFIYSLNHIENYLIPDLENMYEYHMNNGDAESANHYLQQADIWRGVLAENEYQKYVAINTMHEDDKNISFDAGTIYEESITTEVTETRTSSYEFSIDDFVAAEVGLSVFGLGTIWSLETSVGSTESGSNEDSETTTTTVGFELADGDQGDYFSVDVMKCHFGNGPVFVTKGGQSSCPYEGGVKVEYADYLDMANVDGGFINGYDLSFPTMRIEVPDISVENAIVSGVPDNLPAEFTLYLSNLSEVDADNWYTLTMDVASNPHGAIVKMDGASISNGVSILIPGGTMLTKTLQVYKGQSGVNDYQDINIILHSQCQFDPTDDLEDIGDTITISAHFVPVCTEVAISNPGNDWLVNASGNNLLPVTIGDYNTLHGTFERIAFQYRSQSASNWNTAMMFFKYEDDYNAYDGAKTLIGDDNVIHYNWDVSSLQDRDYLIRAVSMCSDGSHTPSEPLAGVIDRQRPQVFGTPAPGNGILTPGDDVMVTFNEPIEEGLITPYNFVVEGVLNGASLHHGTSVQLNGISDYVAIPEGINLSGQSFALELWMQKPLEAQGTILSFGNEGQGTFSWNFTDSEVVITINDEVFSALNPLVDANWHHWALTWDNASQALALYADDQLVLEQTAPALAASGPIYWGKRNYTDDNHLYVHLHDIRVWRKALSFNEIVEQMNTALTGNEMGLLGYWPANEGKGNQLTDLARSRNATLSGNWSIQPGGNAYTFNGIDQALIANTSAIPISGEMDLTLELWFTAGAQDVNASLISNGADDPDLSPANKTINIYLNENGNVVVESNGISLVSPQTYLDNTWHHVAFVVNRRGYATLFIDSDPVAQVTAPQMGAFESAFAYIGARGYMDNSLQHVIDNHFNGSIDEVRIWNTARRQKQIEMYAYHRLEGNEAGLKAYFPFEKYEEVMGVLTSVTTVEDQSIDPDSSNGDSHCGSLEIAGNTHFAEATPPIRRQRAKSTVNFDYVINNDRIIITPNEDLTNIERCILEFTVKNIEDKNGNRLASPVAWTAFVEQNLVRWGQDEFTFNKEIEEPLTFSTTIVNLGGTHQSFNLSNLPEWLSASPTNGTLNPNSEVEVEFVVANDVKIGRYNEEIYLESSSGYNEKLFINLNVFKQAPDWIVDESLYSQSMNVIGKLRIRQIFSTDENDMIGVFAGNECRGVATLEYKENYDDYFLFLVVYGNAEAEDLTYKVWDASEGKIYSDVSPAIIYEPNAMHGTVAEPVMFDVSGLQDNTLTFNPGWNWVSFNLEMMDPSLQQIFANMLLSNGDLISHAEWYSTYNSSTDTWLGTLTELGIGKLYRVYSEQGGDLTYMGSQAAPAEYPIELVTGWSRIGFVPNVIMTVNEALSGFEPQTGDVIKGQHQFAMWDGYEWIGSLKNMRPGRGYMYRSLAPQSLSFSYPDNPSGKDGQDDATDHHEEETPQFNLTRQYEHSMNLIAKVEGIQLLENDLVAAFVNGSLRSSTLFSDMPGYEEYVFLTIAGETHDYNQPVEFRLIRGNESIALDADITFAANAIEGELKIPVILMAGESTNISDYGDDHTGVKLYPNPFTKSVDIQFFSATPGEVEITIVNSQGALVAKFAALPAADGMQKVTWNGENLRGGKVTPGVYYVKIRTNQSTRVFPVVKTE